MPKSKKKKKADFQKVKLKVGKRLSKGTNETNISFKTRTLKVSQTLKDYSQPTSQPQTKGKLNLQELIQRCSLNKSCSQRLSAIEGFKELLLSEAGGKDAVLDNLSVIMQKVSELLADPEPTVRQAVLRFCRTLFSQVGSEQYGFFDYLSAHLCCAMNNISDSVRQDALTMFDLLLEKYSRRVIGAYCNLVPTLVFHITSQMLHGSKGKTLVCNPNSRLSSQKWRMQVLQRLTKIVETFVEEHRENEHSTDNQAEVVYSGDQFPNKRWPTVHPSIKVMWSDPLRESKYGMWKMGSIKQDYSELTRNAECLQKFAASLMPLIKQCWIEEYCADKTVSSQGSADTGHQLKEESLPMVRCLVGLLDALVECWRCVYTFTFCKYDTATCWFCGDFLQYLRDLLLPKFPVYVMEKAHKDKQSSSGKQSSLQASVLRLNLQICGVLAAFPPRAPADKPWPEFDMPKEDWQKDIARFLLKNLKYFTGADLSKRVTAVLHRVFFNFTGSGAQDKLLAKAQKYFCKAHPLSTERRVYLELFQELAFDLYTLSPYHAAWRKATGSLRHSLLEPYFQALPELLLQLRDVNNSEAQACQLIEAMCHHTSDHLTASMEQHMEQMLDVEKGVFAVLPRKCHSIMVRAISWTYQHRPAPEHILKLVELVIRLPQVEQQVGLQLCAHLLYKYTELFRNKKFLECKTYYLSFFFSVLVGHKRSELEKFHHDNSAGAGKLSRIIWTATTSQLLKHSFIVHFVRNFFGCLMWTSSGKHGRDCLEHMAEAWTNKILTKYCALSVFTALSAMSHWEQMVWPLENFGECMHVDDPEVLAQDAGEAGELISVFNSKMRPFTKLGFSAAYSVVSVEMSDEVVDVDSHMVELLWKAVVDMVKRSLRILLDLCQYAAEFVQAEQCEEESMKTVMVMTKLLSSEKLSDLSRTYKTIIKREINSMMTVIKNATPQIDIEEKIWWQDFLKCPL